MYSRARKHLTSSHRNVGTPDIQRLLALVEFESQKLRELLGNEVFGRSSVRERVCPVLPNTRLEKETVTVALHARDVHRRHTAVYRAHRK